MPNPQRDIITRKPGLWGVMAPVKGRINFAIFLGALSSLLVLAALVSLAWVIDSLLKEDAQVWMWVGLALLFTILGLSTKLAAFTLSHLAAFKLETILRTTMAEHLARLPLGFLIQNGSGALTKVMQDDVKALHAFVADSTPFYGRSTAMPLVTFVLLFLIDWRLALVATAVLILGVAVMSLAMKDHKALADQYDAERERINNTVIEFVQAMPVVRTFDDGTASFGRYEKALDAFREIFARWMQQSGTAAKAAMVVLSPLPTLIALFVAGGLLYANGQIEFSTWLAILLIGSGMAESIMPLMWLNHFIRKAQASALRIQELLKQPGLVLSDTPKSPQDASVSFDHVSFNYGIRSQNALQDTSFEVPSGTVTALVGPSGAGKSTAAKLIPRFWDVTSGAIRVGGVDVRDIEPEVLMEHVSFVFQDTFLFHDTLANNISLGLPNATREEIEAAAKAAQAHDFIQQLPQGYDTIAGDRGTRLSGGQRQRITIARAILQNRPIVVLDEATAFADPENEAALIQALANLMQGRTVIIIAHRLATIKDADQIVVFDQGKVAEKGQHQQLVDADGVYARLWRNYEKAQGWSLGSAADNASQSLQQEAS
ncbi:ABC transporter ATP-binding protein [Thiomicrorhabdus sp.]|uniref:ABC transporter ATP-binding protein n=1 Tax=Thiomicrorhabdus sp. TaxID=2039724 RepID=UPI0029C62D1C|nr:ABC transporter ATP-binding protein [Thiomicrorhabdus sp.]